MSEAEQEDVIKDPLSSSEQRIIDQILAKLQRDLKFNHEILDQAADIAFVSRTLQLLRDLDINTLQLARDLGLLTLQFHPPVDIPAYTEDEKNPLADSQYTKALAIIGRHIRESTVPPGLTPATVEQILMGDLQGAAEFSPAVRAISAMGAYLFRAIDRFDENRGAIIQGIAAERIKKLILKLQDLLLCS